MDDAKRENRTAVVNYLINEALVRNFCDVFEDGLFDKGVQYTMGIYHKKFHDLQLMLNSIRGNATAQLMLLKGWKYLNNTRYYIYGKIEDVKDEYSMVTSTDRIFEIFFSSHELYLYKVIEQMVASLALTYDTFHANYQEIA